MKTSERTLVEYTTPDGKSPLETWLRNLKDTKSKARILNRIDRLRLGNFGDCKSVGSGVYELRVHFGPGFRIYFGLEEQQLVILLCGGDKDTQQKDVARAIKYWEEHKNHGD